MEMELNTAAVSSDENEFGRDQQQKWPSQEPYNCFSRPFTAAMSELEYIE